MSVSSDRVNFNSYDVISNFFPGAVVLIGITLPHPDAAHYFTIISIGGLIVWTIVAFAIGIFLQALSTYVRSIDEAFGEKMSSIVSRGESDDEVTASDVHFVEAARDEFQYDENFEDWDQMYREVLTVLENNPPSRAIRLQSMFLALRALCVGLGILAITTAAYLVISLEYQWGSNTPPELLGVATLILVGLVIVAYVRSGELSDAVVSYMIAEFLDISGRGSAE